eukprot:CFRG7161T1
MSLINSLANLAFFPTELLEQILSFISLSDVLQVRLTCKALNQAFSVRVWSSIIVHNHGQKCGLQHSIMYDTWTLKLTSLCPINKFVIKHFMRGRNRSSIAEENYIYKAHLDGIKRLRPLLPGSLSMDTRAGTSGHQPGTHICGIDSRTILLQCRCVVVLSILLEDVRVQPCVVVRNDFVRNGLEDMLKVLITSRPDQAELFLREKSKIHKRLQSSSNAIVID